jgi:cytochrome b6-f complex iron-sulfur subunit
LDRKEFLSLVGISAAAFGMSQCLQGCSKSNTGQPTAPSVDFTLDLTNATNNALKNNGGYIYKNGVIVAKTMTGTYIAVSQACTHQGVSVVYEGTSGFYCTAHGSSFSASGTVTGGPAGSNLKSYTTTLSGSNLRVTG